MIGLVVIVFFFRNCVKETIPVNYTTLPVSCRISLLSGTEDRPSLLTVRLFSQTVRQAKLRKQTGRKKDQIKTHPVMVKIPPDMWQNNVLFFKLDRTKNTEENISSMITFLKGPQSSRLVFGPDTVYSIYYELPSLSSISSKDAIQARIQIEGFTIVSNTFNFPEPSKTKEDTLYREIAIAHRLKQHDILFASANEMIKKRPGNPDGYFFKGIALEGKKLYKEALESYQKSLKLVPKPEKGQFREPPDLLYSRIREVKKKLDR